jgi:hypothetical protein
MYASPQMGQMPRMSLNFDFNLLDTQRIFPAPQAYMQAPPGQYPPPPNGAGPRPSMPPTPIPAHAHPYYHQSPQRTSHNLSFCITDQTVHSICHSPTSCPVSNDDAPAWWAWWPTARLRWRSCTTRAHGWCRPCMMQEIVCHCCLFFFLCFLLGGYAFCVQLRAAWLLCTAFTPISLAWHSFVLLSHCAVSYLRCPCIHSMRPLQESVLQKVIITKKNEQIRDDQRYAARRLVYEKTISHPELRITRFSSITLSECCCSCCNSPVTTSPSRLAMMRECL